MRLSEEQTNIDRWQRKSVSEHSKQAISLPSHNRAKARDLSRSRRTVRCVYRKNNIDRGSIFKPLICQDKHYRCFSFFVFAGFFLFSLQLQIERNKKREALYTIQRLSMRVVNACAVRFVSNAECACMIHNLLAKRSSECLRLQALSGPLKTTSTSTLNVYASLYLFAPLELEPKVSACLSTAPIVCTLIRAPRKCAL